ncbi:T4 bacteriophage base plate protein [Acinetobacter baumannii]|uniref:Baseplate n=1 Tax=Acinetobacter phage AbTZA1 TaxID=2500827 RepID=A0A3T0IGR5_9CAUD|nr:baseplate [Acinetobacter phage AbTZA1]AZU98586.1 baseplate [Acinetobacter phage AbTZA1]SSU39631.1 T4 bacteriophage base plate protein [Acinetobacter baumannii]
MANIIRCRLPDGIHRFKPFNVADYRDFLLVRNDMMTKDASEQLEIVNELAEDYFGEYPKSWQQYLFLNVFTGSVGKTKVPIIFECPTCGKTQKRLFNLSQDELVAPLVKLDDTTELEFKFPDKVYSDNAKLVLENIDNVKYNGEEYKWEDLDTDTQDTIIEMLDFEKFEHIVKKLKPLHFEMNISCCEKHVIVFDDLASIFRLLINPDEVFPFYEINNILIKNNYDWNSIMNMLPAERSIALSMIEKDSKQ